MAKHLPLIRVEVAYSLNLMSALHICPKSFSGVSIYPDTIAFNTI